MIARGIRPRSGITLTEILIAILIMGVGLISLATLFPLGLLRLREAARYSRAGLANQTAADDMDTRSLFYKPAFRQTWYGTRDPFVQDVASDLATTAGIIASNPYSPNGQNPNTGAVLLQNGLPFCYDPLWRDITGVVPNSGVFDPTLSFTLAGTYQAGEARFGDGYLAGAQPYLRNDPDGNPPSAYGLQRLSNFVPWSSGNLTYQFPFTSYNLNLAGTAQPLDAAANVFTSIDDIVFNPTGGNANNPSSVLPDMSAGVPVADYKYTWFVTGRQTDAGGNGTQFVGEVVVCDGQPLGYDLLPSTTTRAAAGEGVYEAIFGFGATGTLPNRSVLLRWPATQPDPQARVGGWICDVTYERNTATYATRLGNSQTSFVRCNWYQVTKRTDPQPDVVIAGSGYRQMVLTVASPIKTQTALNGGVPVHVNVALVMPSVINVFPRSFEVH